MKNLTLALLSFGALAASALHAQNVAGTWQGSLSIPSPNGGPQTLRIVIKVMLVDDKLTGTAYSIDQGAQFPVGAITKDGANVRMTMPAVNGSYEGRLSADGSAMTGTWTQGAPLPLNLTRATPETAWTIPEPAPPPKTMPAEAKPSFEVSTIKPAKPEEGFSLLVNRSGMLNTTGTTLNDLIKFAYDLHPRQITGGPAWRETEKFDVSGKPDTEGIPSVNQLKGMVRKLLAERFELKFHFDKKELSVYAITVAKGGVKMTKEESNPNGLPGFGGGPQGLNVRNSTVAEFAAMLQANILEQPVVDQTGLGAARYNFLLKFTRDPGQGGLGGPAPNASSPNATAPGDPDAPPDIFTAFQQQLGLKLESTKAPADVMVIDTVAKPSDN